MPGKGKLYGCVRCMTFKSRDSFAQPDGTTRRRIDSVCLECREVERLNRERRARARERNRTTKEIDGVLSRRCGKCKKWKPLTREHYYRSKTMRDGTKDFDYYCKTCQTTRTSARARQRRTDPETAELERILRRDRTRSWRARNPERARKLAQEYKRRIKKDPVRYARMRESQRIAYRLRKERAGQTYNETRQKRRAPLAFRGPSGFSANRLDATPLREWLDAVIEREVPTISGAPRDGNLRELAQLFGIHERQLLTIRRGEYQTVTLTVADTLLTRYGQPVRVNGYGPVEFLWDLWPELAEDDAA